MIQVGYSAVGMRVRLGVTVAERRLLKTSSRDDSPRDWKLQLGLRPRGSGGCTGYRRAGYSTRARPPVALRIYRRKQRVGHHRQAHAREIYSA